MPSDAAAAAGTRPRPAAVPSTRAAGLTADEAARRLRTIGRNAMPDLAARPLRDALGKLWAPVPWMLEAAIVLQLVLGDDAEAAIIAGLLVFNAALGLFQQNRAQATLTALKARPALSASVRRDGRWITVPAAELVPGDIVTLSLGGVVAADARLTSGEVLLDQSMLTANPCRSRPARVGRPMPARWCGAARRWRR